MRSLVIGLAGFVTFCIVSLDVGVDMCAGMERATRYFRYTFRKNPNGLFPTYWDGFLELKCDGSILYEFDQPQGNDKVITKVVKTVLQRTETDESHSTDRCLDSANAFSCDACANVVGHGDICRVFDAYRKCLDVFARPSVVATIHIFHCLRNDPGIVVQKYRDMSRCARCLDLPDLVDRE
ncbi:MAG: hypothetical protein IH991_22535 [Planctomycetes bacterium]|nr:hypothetical protein [Planctomycetota bacterium]